MQPHTVEIQSVHCKATIRQVVHHTVDSVEEPEASRSQEANTALKNNRDTKLRKGQVIVNIFRKKIQKLKAL